MQLFIKNIYYEYTIPSFIIPSHKIYIYELR